MGKKRGWFSIVKRLFIPHTKSKVEKKTKTWGWVFGGLKIKQYPEIACSEITLSEATQEQRKQVLAVAMATAAAAEAAIAAANAAAEVVKLTNFAHDSERRRRMLSAIRIQCAYRRHLAKKALSALKGMVKLQAVIRGENARRKFKHRLRSMALLEKSASRVHRIRVPLNEKAWKRSLGQNMLMEPQESNIHDSNNKNWNLSSTSKQETESLWIRKQDAINKRERMKKYSYSHRESRNDQMLQDLLRREHETESCWFNQLKEVEREEKERSRSRSFLRSDTVSSDTYILRQLTLSNAGKHDITEALDSPFSLPRRSFTHAKQKFIGDDMSLPNSPAFPNYMGTTESAKAKIRCTSMPKQRLVLSESYSGQHLPFKSKISSWSSFNGNINSCCRNAGIFRF